jgi:WD40 repeat protein
VFSEGCTFDDWSTHVWLKRWLHTCVTVTSRLIRVTRVTLVWMIILTLFTASPISILSPPQSITTFSPPLPPLNPLSSPSPLFPPGTARLWDCADDTAVRIFHGHTSDVDVARVHPNGAYVGTT